MKRHNPSAIEKLSDLLTQYKNEKFPLPGIETAQSKNVFVRQIIDSFRKAKYISAIAERPLSLSRSNPDSEFFDPLKAALIHRNADNFDEACWLIFLFVHFGKHQYSRWRFLKEVYGKLGHTPNWTWEEVSANPQQFRDWLRESQAKLLRGDRRGFGQARKYQSMDADKPAGTGIAIQSYVTWAIEFGGHRGLIKDALSECNADRKETFDYLYRSMSRVVSFGRTAKFDYLTMLGKMNLAPIEPGFAYLAGATSPLVGARLMLQGSVESHLSLATMESRLVQLAQYLDVGMQVIEDSICNWHKSPEHYILSRE